MVQSGRRNTASVSDNLVEMKDNMDGPFGIVLSKLYAGSVLVGSDKGSLPYGSERPRHEVQISDRWITTGLVNRGAWASAMGEEFSDNDDFPVEGKSWEEIEIFISKVSDSSAELEGEWRLPSESEWLLAQKNLGITVPVSHEELLLSLIHI